MRNQNANNSEAIRPKLLDQVRAKIRVKHFSRRTEEAQKKQAEGCQTKGCQVFNEVASAFSLNCFSLFLYNKPWHGKISKMPKHKKMDIRIGYNEVELRSLIKSYGAKWDPERKLWSLSYEKIKELDLLERIVDDK